MKILALESSATAASVSLIEDDKLLCENYINIGLTHSQTIMPLIDGVLKYSKVSIEEIDLFCVATGPGSFTGVRIGVSVVKGLAMVMAKPCIGVSTLESLAYNFYGIGCIVCSVMDARRDQVYNAIFRITDTDVERLTSDRAISIQDLKSELLNYSEKVYLVGDGADLVYTSLDDEHTNVILSPIHLRYQHATSTAVLAKKISTCGLSTTAKELLPTYLRLSQAERELKKRNERKC